MAIKAFSEIKESNMVSETNSEFFVALQCYLWLQSSATLLNLITISDHHDHHIRFLFPDWENVAFNLSRYVSLPSAQTPASN